MSIQKILVPTDFSEVAKSALKVAVTIAQKANAELHLLHIVHIPVIDPYTPAETINTIKEEEEKASQQQLAALALEFGQLHPQIHVKLGFAVDEIVDFSAEHKIDLVVMGTTGASGLEEALLGSNASSVAERIKVPLLSIPDEMKEFGTKDIVYATDLEGDDLEVLHHLNDLATTMGSNLHLLHVRNNDLPTDAPQPEDLFKAMVTRTGINTMTFHEIKNENTAEGITQYIHQHPCDILAMAHQQRGFFAKLFHSSLTKKMVNHSHIPVLTYYK